MENNSESPANALGVDKPTSEAPLAATHGSDAMPKLTLTPREELAVIVERLKQHEKDAKDEGCKLRLEFAADLVRFAMNRR